MEVRFWWIRRMGRILSQYWREFIPKRGTAMAMERLEHVSDEVTEGRSSVKAEGECVEREGWLLSS